MIGLIIFYALGLLITAGIGALMMFTPFSIRAEEEDREKRRGAKAIILSPVWPFLALVGIKWVWVKARETLKEDQ